MLFWISETDSKQIEKASLLFYRLLALLPQAALDAMRADAKLSSVHEAVVNRLKSKAPHLESKLTRNCGFATGLEFKEGAYVLNAKSEQRLRPGMAFNLALGLEKLEEKIVKIEQVTGGSRLRQVAAKALDLAPTLVESGTAVPAEVVTAAAAPVASQACTRAAAEGAAT